MWADDCERFVKEFNILARGESKRFLITGGTGLIGSSMVKCLKAYSSKYRVTLPVRSKAKAQEIFGEEVEGLTIIECELDKWLASLEGEYDYIIHCASPTAGVYMVEHPASTFTTAVSTTMHLLEYCRRHSGTSMVYISSLEYYGQNYNDAEVTEDKAFAVDHHSERSSYPIGKRAAEYACYSYAKEFGVDVKVARLTQTFGPGVAKTDNRVFAQFARSVINNEDIVMHTTGESAKPYCYITDCISAILHILVKGEKGEAYNAANEETYISIRDMANFLKDNFNPNIKVIVEEHPEMGYAPQTRLNLSTEKLRQLGWKPQYDLKTMFGNLIEYIKTI